jgi:hypothetical protein
MAGTELGKAYVQIIPSAQGISGSISKTLSGESASAGQSAGTTIGSKIKGAILAAGIGTALKSVITEGAALEQSIGGIETLFKGSADTIKQYAAEAYSTAGISANNYMELATSFSASLLQSLSGNTQQAAKYTQMAITDMSDNANKMGTDMQSIQWAYQGFAKQNYTMLDNLKLGYGGTKSEMERLLSDAQELTGVKYDINNLSDVYEAIHVIQGELGITGTTAKEAEQTLSGSFNSMKAAAQNLMGELVLGGELQSISSAMSALVETASTFLFNNLLPAIGNIIASLPAAIGTLITTAVPQLAQQGVKLIKGLTSGINNELPQFIAKFPEMVSQGLAKISEYLPMVAEKGGALVLKLVQGLLDKLPSMITALSQIGTRISTWMSENSGTLGTKVGEMMGNLAATIVAHLPEILLALGKLSLAAIEAMAKLPVTMAKYGASMIKSLAAALVPDSVKKRMEQIKYAMTHPIEAARDAIRNAINRIKSFFNITLKFKGIKLPHITVSWNKKGALAKIASKLGLPGVPDFGVSWYKTGGIFSDPSVIGVGEAGSEAVVPLDKLWEKFDRMAESIIEATGSNVINQEININQPVSGPVETARAIRKQMQIGLAGV